MIFFYYYYKSALCATRRSRVHIRATEMRSKFVGFSGMWK